MPAPPREYAASPRAQRVAGLRASLHAVLRGSAAAPAEREPREDPSPLSELIGPVGPRRLLDCLAGAPGSGAGLVALWLCARACARRGELVVIDPEGSFYPPAAVAWGVDSQRLLVVRPASATDALAAAEVALRSPAVGAVWASQGRIEGRAFRRLLLAAEAGEALGALVRPARHGADPSWGDTQLRFDPIATQHDPDGPFLTRVTRTRNRHGPAGGDATLRLDWRTGRIEEAPQHEPSAQHPAARRAPADARRVAPRLADPAA